MDAIISEESGLASFDRFQSRSYTRMSRAGLLLRIPEGSVLTLEHQDIRGVKVVSPRPGLVAVGFWLLHIILARRVAFWIPSEFS